MTIAVMGIRNKLFQDWKKLLSCRLQQTLLYSVDGVELSRLSEIFFSSLPKDRIYLVLVRELLIACFSESSLKLCIPVRYPLFRDPDIHDAQERQNTAPSKAEGLPDPCVDFSKECHFSDFAKIWLFLKITSLFFSNLLP